MLDNLDDILSVEGIDLFASGAQDIAQSMGLQGQPNHPDVQQFEATVRDAVHAAGRQMADDVMASMRADHAFPGGGARGLLRVGASGRQLAGKSAAIQKYQTPPMRQPGSTPPPSSMSASVSATTFVGERWTLTV